MIIFQFIFLFLITVSNGQDEYQVPIKSNAQYVSYTAPMNQYVAKYMINCAKMCPNNQYGTCLIPYSTTLSRFFYRCVDNEAFIASCYLGMVYSPKDYKCVPKEYKIPPLPPSKTMIPSTVTANNPLLYQYDSEMDPIMANVNLQINSLAKLITMVLGKADHIEKRIRSTEKKMKKMNILLLNAIYKNALICRSQFNPQMTDSGLDIQTMMFNQKQLLDTIDTENPSTKMPPLRPSINHLPPINQDNVFEANHENGDLKEDSDLDEFQKIIDSVSSEMNSKILEDDDEDEEETTTMDTKTKNENEQKQTENLKVSGLEQQQEEARKKTSRKQKGSKSKYQ